MPKLYYTSKYFIYTVHSSPVCTWSEPSTGTPSAMGPVGPDWSSFTDFYLIKMKRRKSRRKGLGGEHVRGGKNARANDG